jgi:hypothetical protein
LSDGTFLGYIALLAVSGILLVILATGGFGQTAAARVIDALFGLGFLGYAGYLLLFFEGGTVQIFFYAFAVPVLAVVNAVKAQKAKREAQAYIPIPYGPGQPIPAPRPAGYHPHAGYPGQPVGYPAQPGQPGVAPQPAPPAR